MRNDSVYPHSLGNRYNRIIYVWFFFHSEERKKIVFSVIVGHAIDSMNEGIISASARAGFQDYEGALERQRTRL